MYLQARYQVMFDVGATTSGGGAVFEYRYEVGIESPKVLIDRLNG